MEVILQILKLQFRNFNAKKYAILKLKIIILLRLVTDGLYSSSSSISVNISDVNEPPVWNNTLQTVFNYPENSTAVETIDIPEDIADEDGDTLSYSLSELMDLYFQFQEMQYLSKELDLKIHLIQMVTIYTI